MRRFLFVLACTAVAAAQELPAVTSSLAGILSFESPATFGPNGWGRPADGTVSLDKEIFHSGQASARIERNGESKQPFSGFNKFFSIDFTGQTIELRGFLRTQEISGWVGLWMREDAEGASVAFDNMQSRQIKGTTDWTEYSIRLPLKPEASTLAFGVLSAGTGKMWADDLQLLVDGKPV